jgi:murein DD-endopeptidase MepM/ murein hydrolase activator NlpD
MHLKKRILLSCAVFTITAIAAVIFSFKNQILFGIYTCLQMTPADSPVDITVQKKDGNVAIFAKSSRYKTFQIKMDVTGRNFVAAPKSGIIRGLSKGLDDPIITLNKSGNESIKYHYHYKYWLEETQNGDATAVYQLPFEKGKRRKVTFGAGSATHLAFPSTFYAVDFAMSEGTPVCAARSGIVAGYWDESDIQGDSQLFSKFGNYVIVQHPDKTYAMYLHLKKGGVYVRPGQHVDAGQKIALSGNTGWSKGPHLHFHVFAVGDDGDRFAVPIWFDDHGKSRELKRGDFVSR